MSTRALAATGELVEDSDTYISSNKTFGIKAILPVVDEGSGTTVSVGDEMRFETTASGFIEIVDSDGHRVGIVPGRSRATVVALTGNAQTGDPPQAWSFKLLNSPPAATIIDVSTKDSGSGGDDATFVTAINAIIAVLDGAGLTKTE